METCIKFHKLPGKGHRADACVKTDRQLGQGLNTAISLEKMNDQYGPLNIKQKKNEKKKPILSVLFSKLPVA